MSIPAMIRKAREGQKMSLQALADKLGVTRQAVWQWEQENGDNMSAPSKENIPLLCVLLDLPPELFYGPQDQQPSSREGKMRLLNEDNQKIIDTMIDALLVQQGLEPDKEDDRAVK